MSNGSGATSRRSYRYLTAELVCAGLAGTVVNTSVTVAVAAIADDLGASVSTVVVTVVLLNVAMAFLMPLSGLAVRAFGSRRVLVAAGAAVFGSSVLVSLSPGPVVLGVARLLQGMGLAAVVPTSVQVSTQLLDAERRRRALGWWAASNGLGLAFAPLVAGLLLDLGGWRWISVPSCILGLALVVTARLGIPAGLRHDSGIAPAAVFSISIIAGTLMAALAAASARAWPVAGALVVVCASALLLARRRSNRTDALLKPATWLRDARVRLTSLGAGLQMVANGMVQVAVPAWLITSGVLTGGSAGAVLMAMTLPMAAMGPLTGRASRVSYGRWLSWGLVGGAAGIAALAFAAAGPWFIVVPGLLVLGLGAGALLSPSLTAFSHTIAGENAVGLAMFNVLRLSSFAVGGLAGGVAVDAGRPWLAFAALSVVFGASSVCVGTRWAIRSRDRPSATPWSARRSR